MTRRRLMTAGALVATLAACAGVDSRVPQATVDRDQLLTDLRVLSADDMEGRLVGSPGGAKARTYVLERFQASGLKPVGESFEHAFQFADGQGGAQAERAGVNVVGRIAGTALSDRCIAVTAHYDHVGVRGGEVFNGADDNASGTAALFAVGRHFSAARPAHCLLLVAFDGEESGLRGAQAFVADPPVSIDGIVLNLNIDMIGRDPDDTLYAVGTHHYPFLKPYIERVAAGASVKLLTGHDEPAKPGVEDWTRDSDHFAFHQAGIPFIYFGVEDYPQHHQATDDYETITHDFYVRAVETIIAVIRAFDADLDPVAAARAGR